jgi:hypothetical protein
MKSHWKVIEYILLSKFIVFAHCIKQSFFVSNYMVILEMIMNSQLKRVYSRRTYFFQILLAN